MHVYKSSWIEKEVTSKVAEMADCTRQGHGYNMVVSIGDLDG